MAPASLQILEDRILKASDMLREGEVNISKAAFAT
jgi:hypothetical protein